MGGVLTASLPRAGNASEDKLSVVLRFTFDLFVFTKGRFRMINNLRRIVSWVLSQVAGAAPATIVILVGQLLLSSVSHAATVANESDKLIAPDGARHDWFGHSVAISGNMAIVGAYGDGDGTGDVYDELSGAAYVFNVTTGAHLFKLTALDGESLDKFGYSVAISDGTAVVGAHGDDGVGTSFDSGAAYLFDVNSGEQLFKLTASDAAVNGFFGRSVAISGNTAIVGSYGDDGAGDRSGAAYVFNVATGEQLFKLTASDARRKNHFGYSVAISGSTAIVGAFAEDDADQDGSGSRSAYLFNVTTGEQLHKLTAPDATSNDDFFRSVAISGNTAIIGAPENGDGRTSSGSAYLFNVTTGEQLFKLTASDGADNDLFGWSVAISGNLAVVGAFSNDDGGVGSYFNSGSAYLFNVTRVC